MKTRIQKWGNSLTLRIPKSFALEPGLNQDAIVDVALVDGKLIVTPLQTPSLEHSRRVAHVLRNAGYDTLHTLDLPTRNRTTDQEITRIVTSAKNYSPASVRRIKSANNTNRAPFELTNTRNEL